MHLERPIFTHTLSVSTGECSFNRPRASSMDPFIESSFSIDPNISSPSKRFLGKNREIDQSLETSYLVIGGGQVRKEQAYVNYPAEDKDVSKSNIISTGTEKSCFVSPLANCLLGSDKPETSSNSTNFAVAPSVSSSSSSAPSSTVPLSSISMDRDLKSPSSLHDSTISRLIDAVSFGNEQDTCGSISALIGQFESTVNQSNLTSISHDHTIPCHSNFKPGPPTTPQYLSSNLKTNNASIEKRLQASAQTQHVKQDILSQVDAPTCAVISSPETAELEEVYTILDEEVLLPISVYNLTKKIVPVQADTLKSTPSNGCRSSPVKAVNTRGNQHNVVWDDMLEKRGGNEETEEECVYEEVYDLPARRPEVEWSTSKTYRGSSKNNDCFQLLHDSTSNSFSEVEINVDEGPLDMMLTSPGRTSQWGELQSPTKQQAIYQNQESTSNYFQQKQSSSYCEYQQQCLSQKSNVLSQCPSPKDHQLSNYHQQQNNFQPSPFHRLANSRPPKSNLFHQNSFPSSLGNTETFNHSREFSSNTQQRSGGGSQILNRSYQDIIGFKQIEQEQARCFYNGFSSSESVAQQSAASINNIRDRGPYSPFSDCDTVYSHLDYDCFISKLESSASRNTKPHCQNQTQSSTPKQSWNQKFALSNTRNQPQPESTVSQHSNVDSISTKSRSVKREDIKEATAPSPCKSKSLGDLTSEDISCNFQSKYRIISRSFITPHMRKQRMRGNIGEGARQLQSSDPLTEQLRKLVSLEGDDSDKARPQPPHMHQGAKSSLSHPPTTSTASVFPRDIDDSPPLLTRRLSSRSQSRVRHINSRARERQQEALKPRAGEMINGTTSIGGVVLRNKPASQNPTANRHSTGSYIAGYFGQLEDRGLPEGACTSLHYGSGDSYGDWYYTDDSIPHTDSTHSASEPEVYFLLRL